MDEQSEELTISCEYLANRCLESEAKPRGYSDCDLENAALIFTHFLMDKMWSENQHISQSKREELAMATGQAIRELILASTGKDMKKISKEKV